MPFQPGNRRQCVFPSRAIQYLVGALNGRTAPVQFTLELNPQFRQIGAIITAAPEGLAHDVGLTANLLPPTTPRAQGGRPRLQVNLTGTGSVSGDLLVIEC